MPLPCADPKKGHPRSQCQKKGIVAIFEVRCSEEGCPAPIPFSRGAWAF